VQSADENHEPGGDQVMSQVKKAPLSPPATATRSSFSSTNPFA
jgi:hypothetical protein